MYVFKVKFNISQPINLIMGQPNIQGMSANLATKMEDIGAPLGIAVLALSVLLLLQGHRRLPLVSFIIGVSIGYFLSPQITPLADEFKIPLTAAQVTGVICIVIGGLLGALIKVSTRMLTSAFIFVTFSTGIQTLNNYGFNVERSNLWSGVAVLAALFLGRGVNRILPMIVSAIFAAYGILLATLLVTGNPLSTFEPVKVKTFALMVPIFVFSLFLQRVDANKQEEKELAKEDPDLALNETPKNFIPL